MLRRSPNGFARVTPGVLSDPSPLKTRISRIALGTQGVPGELLGARVNPLAVKTYCPFSISAPHWFVDWAAAKPGSQADSARMATHLVVKTCIWFSFVF